MDKILISGSFSLTGPQIYIMSIEKTEMWKDLLYTCGWFFKCSCFCSVFSSQCCLLICSVVAGTSPYIWITPCSCLITSMTPSPLLTTEARSTSLRALTSSRITLRCPRELNQVCSSSYSLITQTGEDAFHRILCRKMGGLTQLLSVRC